MSDKSNKYGYVGVDIPAQSFGSNKGVFNPAEINDLVANNQWTSFGQLELIQTQVADGTSTYLDFTNIKQDIYNVHFVTFSNIQWGTADTFKARVSNDNGATFIASGYYSGQLTGGSTGSFSEATRTNYSEFDRILQNQANIPHNGYCYFYNLGDSTKYNTMTQHTLNWAGGVFQFKYGSQLSNSLTSINALRFFTSTYNILSGATISLYGIRYS